MKANELMINDWVWQRGCTTPSKVVGVTSNKIYTYWADNSKHAKDAYYFDPIPLTEEILEKNGWILVENEYRSPEDIAYKESLRLQIGEDGNAFWWIVGCVIIIPINYVHELQHALRLCGLTDLADNFKI